VAFERKQALARAHVPNFGCVVKRAGEQLVAVCVEVQTYDFCAVATQIENFVTGLDIPQFSCIIHRASGHKHAVGVKGEADNFHFVAFQGVVALACICVPNFRFLVERACDDFVSGKVSEQALTRKDC
jgi:hypothetical protein